MVYVSSNTGMYASGAASYASSSTFSEYNSSSSSKKKSVCCGSFQRGARCYSCPGAY